MLGREAVVAEDAGDLAVDVEDRRPRGLEQRLRPPKLQPGDELLGGIALVAHHDAVELPLAHAHVPGNVDG